jgi:hypothetical protein
MRQAENLQHRAEVRSVTFCAAMVLAVGVCGRFSRLLKRRLLPDEQSKEFDGVTNRVRVVRC